MKDFELTDETMELDPHVLNSGLMSILENAVDACLEEKTRENYMITFNAKQDGDFIIFKISDDGIGMDRETKESIFTLFFSSKASRGTGLGLFVANEIIQQHGGSIKVNSTPGQGSQFQG